MVRGCLSSDLVVTVSGKGFYPTIEGKEFKEDLIYLWAVSKRRWEWYTTAHFLNEKDQTVIVNKKAIDPGYRYYLCSAYDYLRQVKENLPFPKSAVVFNAKGAQKALRDFSFPLILKKSESRQGKGIYKVEDEKELVRIIEELKQESSSFVMREFIPNDGDIRVFTVGYKAIGAMKRTPRPGDFRSNISQGGSGEKFDLTSDPKVREIAEKASWVTATEIAGVDIIINRKTKLPYILEINPGPQFEGLEKYTQTNAALEIIKYFESLKGK
jgi:RimK family alpha-L-glutamate ligase